MKKGFMVAGLSLALAFTVLFSGCAQKPSEKECTLSLCDCKCHAPDQTPEQLGGKICGINCIGEQGVTGCENKNGKCVEKYLTEEDSKKIAEDYIKNAPTYKFNGFDLEHDKTITLRCPFCWQLVYEFKCRDAGYGDRSGQVLAEVITDHRIYVTVDKGQISRAVIDDKWDEKEQEYLDTLVEECSGNSDCAKEERKCADGIDPYHVCQDGKCVQLTFVADPCLMEHVCPKGRWNRMSKTSCFVYQKCSLTGCDDNSGTTKDECVDVGTRSEGCLHTISSDGCRADADCVPEQCCHPTSCMNKRLKEPCNLLCTQVCEGPIDCGAGKCACVDNKCVVEASVKSTQ